MQAKNQVWSGVAIWTVYFDKQKIRMALYIKAAEQKHCVQWVDQEISTEFCFTF
jgi:hypothetical protein